MKKKTAARGWRLAGEPLEAAEFSPSEERLLTELFTLYKDYRGLDAQPTPGISAARSRENAMRAAFPFFLKTLEGKYRREEIAGALATAVFLPVRCSEWFVQPEFSLLGAAYWILDYAERENLLEELYALLPEKPLEETAENGALVPEAEDLAWPRPLVLRLMAVLVNRKTAGQKEFHKILGLIREKDAAVLRETFRDALVDYFTRFLEVRTRVRPAGTPETPASPALALSPVPDAKALFDTDSGPGLPSHFSAAEAMRRCPDLCFLVKTPPLIGASRETIQEEFFYRRMTGLLSEFTVRDPYSICAAFLLLESENDLLVQLNALTSAVTICAERHLPWAFEEADVWQRLYSEEPPDYRLCRPFQPPEAPEQEESGGGEEEDGSRRAWGKWEDGAGAMIDRGRLLSDVQLFYLATGYILPRDRSGSERLAAWFRRQGVPEDRARELAFGAALVSRVEDGRVSEQWRMSDPGTPEPKTPDSVPDTGDAERIAELTRQLKASRLALHDAEQSARQMRERLREEEKRGLQDRMELSGLRDTLFRMKAGESPEDRPAAGENLEFPWPVKRRVLVFGGHDTWSKAIRPLLPGVRFFDRESLPDLNAIKGADVVWIQANALSHKFYYRIIETARREGISVQYFGFASARKCAEQLVANELAADDA